MSTAEDAPPTAHARGILLLLFERMGPVLSALGLLSIVDRTVEFRGHIVTLIKAWQTITWPVHDVVESVFGRLYAFLDLSFPDWYADAFAVLFLVSLGLAAAKMDMDSERGIVARYWIATRTTVGLVLLPLYGDLMIRKFIPFLLQTQLYRQFDALLVWHLLTEVAFLVSLLGALLLLFSAMSVNGRMTVRHLGIVVLPFAIAVFLVGVSYGLFYVGVAP